MTNKETIKKYNYAIKSLEDKIKILKKDVKYNMKDFEDLKKKIDYKTNKNSYVANKEIKDSEKIFIYKDLEIKSSKYLTNMLLNGNEYIIVDSSFYKKICEKGKKNPESVEYIYTKNKNELNLTLAKNDVITFNINEINNRIDASKLKKKTSESFKEIEKTLENIKKYYNFEIALENDLKLKPKGNNSNKGYLIEKEALDKWKEKIQYDEIKNKYLTKKNLDKETKDKLIYLFEKNNLTFFNLIEIKNAELNIYMIIQLKLFLILIILYQLNLKIISSNRIQILAKIIIIKIIIKILGIITILLTIF